MKKKYKIILLCIFAYLLIGFVLPWLVLMPGGSLGSLLLWPYELFVAFWPRRRGADE